MNRPSTSPTTGERLWRSVLFFLSAAMAALALVDFELGRMAKAIGDLGACALLLSLIAQYPFLRTLVEASREPPGSPEQVQRQREALLQQAQQMRLANPWADRAGRAGWALLAISLLLRIGGIA
jgi:hypothetical protein